MAEVIVVTRRMLVLLWLGVLTPAAHAQPALEPLDQAVCRLIEDAAAANRLPVGFLTRVIWRESSFRSGVVSPAGAQGIAQFMPGTARERGLADPFDPEQAIPKAARLLAELRREFGGLAAAAAAYNAGPARLAGWLRGAGGLPAVTLSYVRFVIQPDEAAAAGTCLVVTAELRRGLGDDDSARPAPLAPWGVQLAGNFSKGLALAAFDRARRRYAALIGEAQPMVIGRRLRSRGTRRFYQVRLAAPTRQVADALCTRIRSVGGACVALRS